MRKTNPQIRWHLTREEKRKIKQLTLRRVPQAQIARIMGITAPSVSRVQKQMHLPTRPPTPEKEIIKLFHEGWSGQKIHKYLRVPANQIYATFHKYGLRRNPTTPKENEERFIQALKRREGYIKTLAKRYKVAFCRANRIAHKVLACPEFRPGAVWPPLSSNFPQRHFDPRLSTADEFVQLVQKVCNLCFAGKLPATDDSAFVAAMVAGLMPTILAGQPEAVLNSFAADLAQAVDCLRREKNCDWKN
jgi:hypothetical protein